MGLAWAGNPSHPNDFNRSLSFADLRPLFSDSTTVHFFSLKKELSALDATLLAVTPEVTNLDRDWPILPIPPPCCSSSIW